MKKMCATSITLLTFVILNVVSGSSAQAFIVTDYGVTIDRYQAGAQETHCFCSDLWGTDIASATVTAPTNVTHAMSFDVGEQQWSYDEIGSPGLIGSKYPDGVYRFDVLYTDDTMESIFVTLIRAFPPFPDISSFRGDRVGWEPWDGSPAGDAIEVVVQSPGGAAFSCEVTTDATDCPLPQGFVQPNEAYTIDILFISSSSFNAYSNSGLIKTCLSTDTDLDGIFDDGNCSGVIGDVSCSGGAALGCDDNCLRVVNAGQEDVIEHPVKFGAFAFTPGGTVVERIDADTGQRLEVIYQHSDNGDFFDYVYYAPGGNPQGQVGLCHFHHGWNEAWFWGPPTTGPFDRVDHITRARWISIDGGTDDNGNSLLEAYDHVYDACQNKYSRRHISCPYPTNCSLLGQDAISDPDGNWRVPLTGCNPVLDANNPSCTVATIDPPLGPETTALFDQILAEIDLFPRADTAMAGWPFDACDLDADGDCDADDRQILTAQISTCDTDPGFNVFADADGSGCVAPVDELYLFVQDLDADGIVDLDDNCRFVVNSDQADSDLDGHGNVCDCDPLDDSVFAGAREVNDGLDNNCPGDFGHGIVDEISFSIRFGGLGVPDQLAWVPQEGALSYEVLVAGNDPFTGVCSTTSTSDPFWIDPATPSPGDASYYLVRAGTPNSGSLGRSSSGERLLSCP